MPDRLGTAAFAAALGLAAAVGVYIYVSQSAKVPEKKKSAAKRPVGAKASAVSSVEAPPPATTNESTESPSFESKIDEDLSAKQLANDAAAAFKRSEFAAAVAMWTAAIERTEPKAASLKVLYNNISAAHENAGDLEASREAVSRALRLDPFYSKALRRRARINELLRDYEASYMDACVFVNLAMMADPQKPQVPADLVELTERVPDLAVSDKVADLFRAKTRKPLDLEKFSDLPRDAFVTTYFCSFAKEAESILNNRPSEESLNKLSEKLVTTTSQEEYANLLVQQGVQLKHARRYAESAKRFSEALSSGGLKSTKLLVQAHNELGTYAHLSASHDQAFAHFRAALKLDPFHPNTLAKLGGLATENGDHSRADEHFSKALEKADKSDRADVLFYRGLCSMVRGDLEFAFRDFQESVELVPTFAVAWMHVGVCLFRNEKVDDAIKALRKAAQYAPGLAEVHSYFGEILLSLGRDEEAAEAFEKCLKLDPSASGPHVNMALKAVENVDQARENEFKEAFDLLDLAIKNDPECENAYLHKAHLSAALGRFDLALENFDRAIEACKTLHELNELSKQRLNAKAQVAFQRLAQNFGASIVGNR